MNKYIVYSQSNKQDKPEFAFDAKSMLQAKQHIYQDLHKHMDPKVSSKMHIVRHVGMVEATCTAARLIKASGIWQLEDCSWSAVYTIFRNPDYIKE